MALHTPVHHTGFAGHKLLRDLLVAVMLAVILLVVLGLASAVKINIAPADPVAAERQSIIEYRAGERADWAAGVPTEGSSLVDFRASERSER